MSDYYEVLGVSSGGELLDRTRDQEGIETIPVEMTRQVTPLKDLKSVWKLYRLFRKESPLIVHTHTPKAGTAGMLAAYLARVPIRLHTVAGLPLLEATGFKRKVLNLVEKMTYACATNVYPNSFGMKAIIEKEGFARSGKLTVLANGSSNGIDTSYFDPALFSEGRKTALREEIGILPGDFVFVFVGRLVKDKGINELVTAFERLSTKYPRVKLVLVGPFEPELDPLSPETMEKLENNPAIHCVGYQNDVRPYLAVSDVLVFPSYREGFPNVVMQAGAMGLPAIVTDINGCNEIVIHGENGLIISPKNTLQLAEKMEAVLVDEDLRGKLKRNARNLISSRFERQVVWDALLEEYRRLEKECGHV